MRRRWHPDGQLTVIPSLYPLSLRDDPAGGAKPLVPPSPPAPKAVEVPKDLDPDLLAHLKSLGANEYRATLAGVPEKYNVRFPDKSPLNKAVLERTTAKARELGLTKDEQAQSVLDFVIAEAQAVVDEATTTHKQRLTEWEKEVLEAPDLGQGKPEIRQAHVARAQRILGKFFPEKFKKVLDEYGIGSNPDFIRGLSKLADLAKEDMIEMGDTSGRRTGTAATRIYKKTKPQEKT